MRWIFAWIVLGLLTACAGPKYTVDDGRKVNEELLGHIRSYGAGEQALRPAIVRAAALKDPDCDTQWELPFSVSSSENWGEDDRVAWVRALGVDERLTVVAAAPGSPLRPGDKIRSIDGYSRNDAERMVQQLAGRRDAGQPFEVTLFSGKSLRVTPFQVCRGYTRLAPPSAPRAQDYHWLMSVHPLEITQAEPTEDEALWTVLWTQGVSEEGGLRMKTYDYGSTAVSWLYNVISIASGLKGAAMAADAAVQAARSAAASVASEVLKAQLIEQAKAMAADRLRGELTDAAQKLTQKQVMNALQQAAVNRGSLSGVARVAATVFDKADAWAYTRMEKLNANPLAGFSLHQKLIERGLTANSMVLDPERLGALSQLAETQGRGDEVVAILQGLTPADLLFELTDMPLATADTGFAYEDLADTAAARSPFAQGLIEAALTMPVASSATSR